MNRNAFGMNLDEGLALESDDEFKLLYVEHSPEVWNRLSQWITNGEEAIMLGGQIGIGKTTFLNKFFQQGSCQADAVIHFDRRTINLSDIDGWVIVFAALAGCTMTLKQLGSIPGEIAKIPGLMAPEQSSTLKSIALAEYSPYGQELYNKIRDALLPHIEFLPVILDEWVTKLESGAGRKIVFLASGIDKYVTDSGAYFSLRPIFSFFSKYKTVFEVNIVHLFSCEGWGEHTEKIYLKPGSPDFIEQVLKRRLGTYTSCYKADMKEIVGISGGLPRQALRLFDNFTAAKKKYKGREETMKWAMINARRDLFSFLPQPSPELLRIVRNTSILNPNYVKLPEDSESAACALYGNWIIMEKLNDDLQLKVQINPLIADNILKSTEPEEPIIQKLNTIAKQEGHSPYGLDISADANLADVQMRYIDSLTDIPLLNIKEILQQLSRALLTKSRKDRVIIAFRNREIAEIVRSWFQAQSNTWEFQRWIHKPFDIEHFPELLHDGKADVYSFDFPEILSEDELRKLDSYRDMLVKYQLIWWIPIDTLPKYLRQWTQLRQLFQVFALEENLSAMLNQDEIQSDIELMQSIADDENPSATEYVKYLEPVLKYLRDTQ